MIARYQNPSAGSTITLADYKGSTYAGLGHDAESADAECIRRIAAVWSVDGRSGLLGILNLDSAIMPVTAPTARLQRAEFDALLRHTL